VEVPPPHLPRATPLGGMLGVALAGPVVALRRGPRRGAGLAHGAAGSDGAGPPTAVRRGTAVTT
jgi:hypothetical protein